MAQREAENEPMTASGIMMLLDKYAVKLMRNLQEGRGDWRILPDARPKEVVTEFITYIEASMGIQENDQSKSEIMTQLITAIIHYHKV